ncbi:uncharacterized protein LOC121429309 [Lytechinus variegatus]|uniref:uncharacterized protein LOC121429309 n=1 Tax=Lytechinus variegatus TaxID=7654 RepID=UPI001BB26C30|nr:uncharacterized protein LOC121429309 [Lytechinus variegatus]
MPAFREKTDELDAYIDRFERHATLSKWPKDCWASALGNLLTGPALDVYCSISAEEATDYDLLKNMLLQYFALTSEGNWKRFREAKKGGEESYYQYANRLIRYVTRCIDLSGKEKTFDALLDVVVREHIYETSERSLSVFMRERNPENIPELILLAEQYRSAHVSATTDFGRRARREESARKLRDGKSKDWSDKSPNSKACYTCGKSGHFMARCPNKKGSNSRDGSGKLSSDSRKQSVNACVVGVCPDTSTPQTQDVGPDSATVKLQCGHEIPLLYTACTVESDMPTCDGSINGKKITVLRDSGCSCVIVRTNLVEKAQFTGKTKLCMLIDRTIRRMLEARLYISTPYFQGNVTALCVDNPLYDLVIGNITGARKPGDEDQNWAYTEASDGESSIKEDRSPCDSDPDDIKGTPVREQSTPSSSETTEDDLSGVTQVPDEKILNDVSQPHSQDDVIIQEEPSELMSESTIHEEMEQGAGVETRGTKRRKDRPFMSLGSAKQQECTATREDVIAAQKADATLKKLRDLAEKGESKLVGKNSEVRFYFKNGLLFREYRSLGNTQGKTFTQLLVPKPFRSQVLRLAHDSALAGHLKTRKTIDRILTQFFWPGLQSDVKRYCASCDACQRTMPKGRIGKVPLVIPPLIDTCFKRIAVDLIGPLDPITDRGNRYILTLVDLATRYPEAVALPRIEAERVAEALVEIFSRLGVPNQILSDNGTQFVSGVMKEAARLLGVSQFHTTPYHPMANGACERFNGTLKQMLRRMCQECPKDWDRYLPALLFAYREVPHESLGYSPFELMYGRTVRGPMTILKELWSTEVPEEEVKSIYQYVIDLQERLESTCELARKELTKASTKYKTHFDVKAKERRFECGDQVLLLLPTSSNKLLMHWRGPYEVVKRVARNNYKLMVNGKEKTYHANLLKRYVEREHADGSQEVSAPADQVAAIHIVDEGDESDGSARIIFPAVEQTESIDDVEFGDDVPVDMRTQMQALFREFTDVMTDVPGKTDIISHSVELTSAEHIRSRPYPVPQALRQTIREEVETMLRMGVIEKSTSPYASPVVIVKKKDGKNRFCVDYRKINAKTVIDNEPIPNIDQLIADIGDAKYFTKIDLSKGYWQIPVVEEDRGKTAFVTPDGQYEFLVLPFGMVNAPAVFTRMMRKVLDELPHVLHYIDDILIYSSSWEEHLEDVRRVLSRLRESHLTARPSKCHAACSSVEFLGHIVGQGEVKPTPEKIKQVLSSSRPTTKREVRSFLGLVGYYRKFIPNMATIATPLSDLTKKNSATKVKWEEAHEHAFQTLKSRLSHFPVPDIDSEFVVRTDASDVGIGAVLMQTHEEKLFPICFASRKLLDRERLYPIVERECLALAWAVKKFAYFLHGRKFTLQTDHFPLAYLSQARLKNPRVLRWALALQSYNFHVEVIKGSDNVGADFLSRCPED